MAEIVSQHTSFPYLFFTIYLAGEVGDPSWDTMFIPRIRTVNPEQTVASGQSLHCFATHLAVYDTSTSSKMD